MNEQKLTHLDAQGHANMVDVGEKAVTMREAWAAGEIRMQTETLAMITTGGAPKGDVLAVARVAGIMAAKRTHELIPLCHPLPLTSVKVLFEVDDEPTEGQPGIVIRARTRCSGQTGVEMEALTAVSVAALTIYDMCKAVDRAMRIGEIRLQIKRGGKSGETILEQVDE